MAPVRTKKGESDIILLSSPVAGSIRTPERSPIKKSMMISQGQKQALIDNLQLEVTERARKLRAQYALQAQSLRTRVELRVNRIPTALKKTNLSQLLEKHMEAQKKDQEPKPAMKPATKSTSSKALPKLPTTAEENPTAPIHATRTRGAKRKSDVLISTDKENTDPIPNPKKRTKTITATAPSRQVTNPSSVLSPKSSNSRTLPHPPFRSPQKPTSTRPFSPLKPSIPLNPTSSTSPAKVAALAATTTSNLAALVGEKLKPTRAPARKVSKPVLEPKTTNTRSRKGATTANAAVSVVNPTSRTVSSSSTASGTSTGTTVVKKSGRPPAAAKKAAGVSAAAKKVTAAKIVEAAAPAAGRRVLRKRA